MRCGNRSWPFVRKQMHRAPRQALAIRGSGVRRGHTPAAAPAKDCFELRNRSAGARCTCRSDLPDATCGTRHPCFSTGLPKRVGETPLRKRPTILASNERKLTAWSGRDRVGERLQDWQRDGDLCLFGRYLANTVANVLATEADRITTAQAGVEQYVEPHAPPCTNRPARIVGRYVAYHTLGRPFWLWRRRGIKIKSEKAI